ncbi:MAG: manganese efflux pump [Candidatus Baltobacteraceae bacterium]
MEVSLATIARVALVAFSLGLDVFAVCVGVGIRGAPVALRIRIGAAFATSEVAMAIIGVFLGAAVGRHVGTIAGYLGFAALVGVGIYMVAEARREGENSMDLSRGWGLFVAAISVSLDSLGIGFSLIYIGAPPAFSLVAIAVASLISTTAGLTFGRALGRRVEESAGMWAGIVLILTGLGFALAKYLSEAHAVPAALGFV